MGTLPEIAVATIAGTGAAGFSDGPASQASFLAPSGLAYAPDGTLYVSDAGAQRIRALSPDGIVRTIAGGGAPNVTGLWVPGAFRDGVGENARFNGPAGIVWSHGTLYVADTRNHCIRAVASNGTVTTYAGSAGEAGVRDGPIAQARFQRPTGLAADGAGNLYVADPGSGLRVISTGGVVTTNSPLSGGTPFGVAVVDGAHGPVAFVADLLGLLKRDDAGVLVRFGSPDARQLSSFYPQGFEQIGYPFAIAAFDADSIVYTDPRSNAIRYLNLISASPQVIGGQEVLDAISSSGGFVDGSGGVSRFDTPLGIAVDRAGNVVVADAGNRRLRRLSGLDRAHEPHSGPLGATVFNDAPRVPNEFRVTLIGNSYVASRLSWRDSIPGIIEARLSAAPGLAGKRSVRVTSHMFGGSPFDAQASFIVNWLAESADADLVVLNFNTISVYGPPDLPWQPTEQELLAKAPLWTADVTAALKKAKAALDARGIPFVVYTTPAPENVSTVDAAWFQFLLPAPYVTTPDPRIGELMNRAVRDAGVPLLDGWSVIYRQERLETHQPMYGTEDAHFSPFGRAVVANAVADYLERLAPWSK